MTKGAWVTTDMIGGNGKLWRYYTGFAGGTGAPPYNTLSQWLSSGTYGSRAYVWGISAGVGSSVGSGYHAFADNIVLGFNNNPDTFNFEPVMCTTVCYADAVNGSDLNDGTTPAKALKTIEKAVAVVQPGGKVIAAPGTYTPPATIVISKPLTLQGPQMGVDPRPSASSTRIAGDATTEAIIDGGGTLGTIIRIESSDVTIDGFEVKNGTDDLIASPGGSAFAIADVTLANLFIHQATGDEGIQIRNCADCVIEYNYIYDTKGDAINLCCGSTNGLIQFNEVGSIGSLDGAIYIYDANATTIQCNLIGTTRVNDGIKLGSKDGKDAQKNGGSILYNTITGTVQDGIALYMGNTVIKGNDISYSASENGAIYLAYPIQNVDITYNNIHDNTLDTGKWVPAAILIGNSTGQSASTITVNNNNITDNTPYGVNNTAPSGTLDATKNWWGDPSGPGGDGSGSGDGVKGAVNYSDWLDAPAKIPLGPCVPTGTIIVEKAISEDGDPDPLQDGTDFEFAPDWITDTFMLKDGAFQIFDVPAGETYAIDEVNLPFGWTLESATCTLDGDQDDPVTADPREGFDVAEGEQWTCVFTNKYTPLGTIIVEKAISEDGDPDPLQDGTDFEFAPDWTTDTFMLKDGAFQIFDVPAGETYAIDEVNLPFGWSLEDATCTLDGDQDDPVTADPREGFDVAEGEQWTCVFTNKYTPLGTIIVEKAISENGDPDPLQDGTDFEFAPDWITDTFTLKGGEYEIFDVPAGETYAIDEVDLPFGWSLEDASCKKIGPRSANAGDPGIDPRDGFEVAKNDYWNCTFTNKYTQPRIILTPSFLVNSVTEGQLTGDGSQACYWITLSHEPLASVVVDVSPGGLLKVDKAKVTLDASNWDNLDYVDRSNFACIRAVDDQVDRSGPQLSGDKSANMTSDALPYSKEYGDHLGTIVHGIDAGASAGSGYGASSPWVNRTLTRFGSVGENVLEVMIRDDDKAGVLFTESFAVTDLDEAGTPVGRSCYWVTLATKPLNPVTVSVVPDNIQVKVNKTTVVLDGTNWDKIDASQVNTGNRVCVMPINDNVKDATGEYCVTGSATMLGAPGTGAEVCGTHFGSVGHSVSSADPKYNPAPFRNTNGPDFDHNQSTIDVLIRDDETLGVNNENVKLVLSKETVAVSEGGLTDSFTVTLGSQPSGPVTVAVSGDGKVKAAPATLSFNASNWNIPQTVVASADDNLVDEGSDSYPAAISLVATSTDHWYQGLLAGVGATVGNNDRAGVELSKTAISVVIGSVNVDTYTVKLLSRPTSPVLVDLNPGAGLQAAGGPSCGGEGGDSCVYFDASNWNVPQTVTVRASGAGRIDHIVYSADPVYNGMVADSVVISAKFLIFFPVSQGK